MSIYKMVFGKCQVHIWQFEGPGQVTRISGDCRHCIYACQIISRPPAKPIHRFYTHAGDIWKTMESS